MNRIHLDIRISTQRLLVLKDGNLEKCYSVSTSALGAGETFGSFKTPRGLHEVRARIGDKLPVNSVFESRRPTGGIYSPEMAAQFPDRDWILSRILWLSGLEPGKNRMGNCDSMRRYIYIHGTNDEDSIGKPASRGCIRMKNHDIIDLFDWVLPGTRVKISE